MDAGQGDATLLVYPDGSLVLVDCGCKQNAKVVQDEIAGVLERHLGKLPLDKRKLRGLVLTHPDGDHYNLVKKIIIDGRIKVDDVIYSGSPADYGRGLLSKLQIGCGATLHQLGAQERRWVEKWSTHGANVQILSANIYGSNDKDIKNTNSVVLLVTYGDVNVFLMGDATDKTEDWILTNWGTELDDLLANKQTVLKLGHHGSATSSCEKWLNKLNPSVVFISSDTRSFGGVSLPRSSVIERVEKVVRSLRKEFEHYYVQYNDITERHEPILTELAIFSTLHYLAINLPSRDTFTAYGTSWYLTIPAPGLNLDMSIVPACPKEFLNEPWKLWDPDESDDIDEEVSA
jgi:competence protein ComEC